jgi:hypothetical protein
MTFDEYVSGKRVCIIGASESLLKEKQAKVIDGYDVVCRVNWGYPIDETVAKHTGNRCDVLYHLMKIGIAANQDFMKRAVADGVKWIVSVLPPENPAYKKFHELSAGIINRRAVTRENRLGLHSAIGGSPNSGQVAIRDLLSFPITELYITGFDFYVGKYYNNYGPHAPDAPQKKPMRHNQVKQLQIFRSLLGQDKRIVLDKTLRGIIEAHKFLDDAVDRFPGPGVEICRRGASKFANKFTVVEEGMRSDVRRKLRAIDWKKFSVVVIHDVKFGNIYHKYLKEAREINPKLKIIIEALSDRDGRLIWRISDRVNMMPDVKMNVAII